MATARLTLSLTEMAQFRRLVEFLAETMNYAEEQNDDDLRELVNNCANDLLDMHGEA